MRAKGNYHAQKHTEEDLNFLREASGNQMWLLGTQDGGAEFTLKKSGLIQLLFLILNGGLIQNQNW